MHVDFARSLALALVLTPLASAQTWSKRFTGYYKTGLLAADGDDAFAGSGVRRLRVAPDGSQSGEWFSYIHAQDVAFRPGGGHVVCGHTQGWVGSLDAANQYEWGARVLPPDATTDHVDFEAVEPTADGGLLVAGARWREVVSDEDEYGEALVYRFDAAGNVLWSWRVGDWSLEMYTAATDVEELPDGGCLVVGQSYWLRMFCARLSATGQVLWWKHLEPCVTRFPRIALLASGDAMVSDGEGTFVRIDLSGDVVWSRRVTQGNALFRFSGFTRTADGGAVGAGYVLDPATIHLAGYLCKVAETGDLVWQRIETDPTKSTTLLRVAEAASGDLLVLGAGPVQHEILVQRFGADGELAGCDPVPAFAQLEEVTGWSEDVDFPQGTNDDPLVAFPIGMTAEAYPLVDDCPSFALGDRACDPAVPNSTGVPAGIWAVGVPELQANDLTLIASALPPHQLGYFLTGRGTGVVMPPGSQGNLCLVGSAIYRFTKGIASSGEAGVFHLTVDVQDIPGHGPISPGETWGFQGWYRDANPTSTSNFTDVIAVTFTP